MDNKIQKDQKNATFEESAAKARYCVCPLHTPPPKGWANHLSHPSALTPEHTPTLTSKKEPTHPTSESGAKELICSHSLCCSKSPNKALLEVLVPPLINLY